MDNIVSRFELLDRMPGGVWNITSRPVPLTRILQEVISIAKSQAEIVMVEEEAVLKSGIKPWTEIPLMSPAVAKFRYFQEIDTTHAKAAGLDCRSLDATLHPLLLWDRGRRDISLSGGMTREQEDLLLR